MVNQHTVKISRVHPIEYQMPLKRPYGTARGVTKASTNFLIRLHAEADEISYTAVGEAQARRGLTGDISTDIAWQFFKYAAGTLVDKELHFKNCAEGLDSVRAVMSEFQTLAQDQSQESNAAKPFRGCLLGLEVALLDLVSRVLNISLSELLEPKRDEVQITVRTLSTQNSSDRLRDRVQKQAQIFPMVRVKGKGLLKSDIDLLHSIHRTNLQANVSKPIWMDLNEGYDPMSARHFIQKIAKSIESKLLPEIVTLEQPVSHLVGTQLSQLQEHADRLTSAQQVGDIRIMPDESIWDIEDLERIHAEGGCRAMNIKTAKAGGILASLDLARRAVELNPHMHLCIGGMVGTSDITTWSLLHLAKAMPRLDYITAVPPSNVQERISQPLSALRDQSSILINSESTGLGAKLAYDKLLPYIKRHVWLPSLEPTQSETTQNQYSTDYLLEFDKIQLDNHLLEAECLRFGLSTLRTSKIAFRASDHENRSIAFSWTKSTASSRTSTAITSDKHSTRLLLSRAGVPMPHGRRFGSRDIDQAIEFADKLGYPVVLKPLRGTGGRGVVIDIENSADLRWAFEALRGDRYENSDVLVEEQIQGASGRAFVVGNEVLSMIHNPHGIVEGDGMLTVGELLLKKHRLRNNNPHLMNRPVKLDEGTQHQLKRQGLDYDSVLPRGATAIYTLNPNPAQGGETADAIEDLHPTFREASVKAVHTIPGLAFGAVDWIIPDHTAPLSDQRAAICEVNAHPSQSGNQFPLYGKPGNISQAIVKLTANQRELSVANEPATELNIRVLIRGRVASKRYSDWFATRARKFGINGNIRSFDDRTVQAILGGPANAVSALASLAIVGPSGSIVESVQTTHIPEVATHEFEIVE